MADDEHKQDVPRDERPTVDAAERRPAPAVLEAGAAFGRYRIEREIGHGGMGVVYLAQQPGLERRVALKVISPELSGDEDFRARFQRESKLAAAIEHRHVIPVYDAGEHEGHVYIAMRYVPGRDLGELLAEQGALDPYRATRLTAQIGAALDAAHSRGLVHRDVKPGNIVIEAGAEESAYLTDFGLTKRLTSKSALTGTGLIVGTVDYIAPEQAQGGEVDARTDVYSLGCVLFQALTGELPYPRDSAVATLYAHVNEPPPSAVERRGDDLAGFDPVIAKAMAKDPGDRFPSAGDLGRAAIAAAEGRALTGGERTVAVGAAAAGATARRSRPGRRMAAAAGVALILAAAAGVAFFALRGDDQGSSGAAPVAAETTTRESPATTDSTSEPAAAAPPEEEPPLEIEANTSGIVSVGGLKPFQGRKGAERAFGKPASLDPLGGEACVGEWPDASVTIVFADFGGGDPCSAKDSNIQQIGIGKPPAEAERWRTSEGLRIGAPERAIRRLYPSAHEQPLDSLDSQLTPPADGAWALIEQFSPIGEAGTIPVVSATVEKKVVNGFVVFVGTAGD